MKGFLKTIGLIFLILIVVIIFLFLLLSQKPMAPNNYTEKVVTGGLVESKYLSTGNYKVKYVKKEGFDITKKYYIYYPEKLESTDKQYPVVVVLNGTGVLPKKYKALFEHLASWGFVVIGNDDESTGFGISSDETIELVNKENVNGDSIFYGKLDLENIGITGHSQGGAGVLTALSIMKYRDSYKTAVALSPTNEEMSKELGWKYDLSKITVPILMLAGTSGDFETKAVIPLEEMKKMYDKLQTSKAMARRIEAEHGHMLYAADGYVTAWFMWQLKGDKNAEKAFIGENPEILNNELYENQKINIGE